ncbi:MAG: TonB family protein [Ignavibacteria bacterium]
MNLNKIFYLLIYFVVLVAELIAQDGLVRNYYPNNRMESAVYYAKDIIHGTARWFFPNGVIKEEKNYLMGKLNGWMKTCYVNSAPLLELFIKDGKRDGISKEFYKNGGLKRVLIYDDGILKEMREYQYDSTLAEPTPQGKTNDFLMKGAIATTQKDMSAADKIILEKSGINQSDNKPAVSNGDEFLLVAEEYPAPVGGLESVQSNINYSDYPKDRVKGIVVVKVFVDDHGYVRKTEVVKSLNKELDKLAENAIKKVQFTSGKLDGKPVNVQITIPVTF